jgi:hypothetical protein
MTVNLNSTPKQCILYFQEKPQSKTKIKSRPFGRLLLFKIFLKREPILKLEEML